MPPAAQKLTFKASSPPPTNPSVANMKNLKTITPDYAVAGALAFDDFAEAAALGFASIINFRPDREVAGQLSAGEGQRFAGSSGLAYVHLPVSKFDMFADQNVAETAHLLATLPRPVLAHCASGQRAAILWAAANARTTPVDDVMATLRIAGFELDFLRDDLDAQANRASWAAASDGQPSDEKLAERAAA